MHIFLAFYPLPFLLLYGPTTIKHEGAYWKIAFLSFNNQETENIILDSSF